METLLSPNGSGFTTEQIVDGLNRPITFDIASDGRIFVAEQDGLIKIIQDGVVTSTFLDISDDVKSFRDLGLTSLALDPNFDTNGYVYLQYTVDLEPDNPDSQVFDAPASGKLVRVTVDPLDPNKADLDSVVTILDGFEHSHSTHTVGDIAFDASGNILFTWGDGGFDTELRLSAQDPNSVQGKLFRIDPVTFEGVPDNPYFDVANPDATASKVLALGIRNSWKISVDEATGDIYLGEVTDEGPEEINIVRADGSSNPNFGWPYFEGDNRTDYGTVPDGFTYEAPYISLEHLNTTAGGDAILDGLVYDGTNYPDIYNGRYFFANTSQGNLYTADSEGNFQQFGPTGAYQWTVDLKEGPDGNIWGLKLFPGELYKIVSTGNGINNDPVADAEISQTADEGAFTAILDAGSSSDPDGDLISYEWDFESDGIVDETTVDAAFTYTNFGKTVTTLRVNDGFGGVDEKQFEFTVGPDAAVGNNLAFGLAASQSGTLTTGAASRAVDGNTDGDFDNGSVSETTVNRSPLWELDLGAVKSIGSIVIFPRTDGEPLDDFFVLVSQVPFSSNNLAAVQTDPGVQVFHITDPVVDFEAITVEASGRYVRVQLESVEASLSLAEVQVIEGTSPTEIRVQDIPDQTQYLNGESALDVFVIDGQSSGYQWGKTISGDGYVIWNETGNDILYDFEAIEFQDKRVLLEDPAPDQPFVDDPDATQFLYATPDNKQFLIGGPSAAYNWGPTEDGAGHVVWNGTGHDILYGFEALIFTDGTVSLDGTTPEPEEPFVDDPAVTQYLNGTSEIDKFVIDGLSADYNWGPTQDGLGIVVWNASGHDLLYDFEEIKFNDRTVALDFSGDLRVEDIAGTIQYVFGGAGNDTFIIDGNSTDFNVGPTESGDGYVVWNELGPDLLFEIEAIEFLDQTVSLETL